MITSHFCPQEVIGYLSDDLGCEVLNLLWSPLKGNESIIFAVCYDPYPAPAPLLNLFPQRFRFTAAVRHSAAISVEANHFARLFPPSLFSFFFSA